jgi:hypothetical protein
MPSVNDNGKVLGITGNMLARNVIAAYGQIFLSWVSFITIFAVIHLGQYKTSLNLD